MVWIKGTRCSVNNCQSQFYQVLSGHRVCQHGHVQVGLETTGDEDDYNAIGRKIKRTKSSQSSQVVRKRDKINVLQGVEAYNVVLHQLQIIIQHQIKFLRTVIELPDNFERVVKDIWTLYLSIHNHKVSISLVQLIAILYLSTRVVNSPVLLVDFNLWIRSSQMPFIQCWKLIDPKILVKIPSQLRKTLKASSVPPNFALHKHAKQIQASLEAKYTHLKFNPISVEYACYRMCHLLMFPPKIYHGAIRIISLMENNRKWPDIMGFGETIPVCAVIISAKLRYGLHRACNPSSHFDIDVWQDLLQKTWLLHPVHATADEKLVQYWDDDTIDSYISWYEHSIIPHDPHIPSRIKSLFPYSETKPEYLNYADQYTLAELTALLQSTDSDSIGPKLNPNQYQAYSARIDLDMELPDLVFALYKTAAMLLGTDESNIRPLVKSIERKLLPNIVKLEQNSKEAVNDDMEGIVNDNN